MTPQQLKDSILQRAIEGKLVEQRPEEGTGEKLYRQIQEEKAKLIKEGKLKKQKSLPEITEDEKPFEIPESWTWVHFQDVVSKLTDGSHNPPPKKSHGYPVISAKNVKNGSITLDNVDRYTDEKGFKKENSRTDIKNGDIILGIIGGSIGNVGIFQWDTKVIAQRSVAILSPQIHTRFLFYLIKSPMFQHSMVLAASGSAQGGVYLGELGSFVIPLPPLAEQKRIVAKIEELQPYVERYEKAWKKLEAFNARFQENMKKSLLQYAIEGKLVEQRRSEGTGKELYAQIQAEKAKLIKEGKLKKQKPLPEITEEKPFEIPESWMWVRLGECVSNRSGLGYKKDNLALKTNHMVRVLRGGNIIDSKLKIKPDDVMIDASFVNSELYLKKNTIITPAVTSIENIGKAARVNMDMANTVAGGFVLMLIPYFDNDIFSMYMTHVMSSKYFKDACKNITNKSGQAFYNLSRNKMMNLVVPLPPLAEQKRIVARLEQLLPYCEQLKKN